MKVPFIDLKAQLEEIEQEIEDAFHRVLQSTSFTMGKEVEEFEKAFAQYCGASHCVAVNSGTSALHAALLAHGIREGDEVITQPNSFFATAEAISYVGAKPTFCDVDPESFGMDVSKIERAITPKTKAIIPVHLYGNAVDMESLAKVAENHNLVIIEDAAQAHGSTYKGKKIGSLGNTACFSFYPAKVLGALGEAGAVVTNDAEIASSMRILRDHGQSQKHEHVVVGYNYRMEQMQAAFLQVKLRRLDAWIASRRKNAELYDRLLSDLEPDLMTPKRSSQFESNYYVYAVQVARREEFAAYLGEQQIGAQIHYPTSIHLQKGYEHLGYAAGDFPVAEKQARETLSLPMYPELQEDQIRYVAEKVHKFFK